MKKSVYEHLQFPTAQLRVNEQKPRVIMQKLSVKKSPPDWYTQQLVYTSTNLTNQKEIYNIKSIYNHKYPTRLLANLDTPSKYPTRLRTQSAISSSALNHSIATELYVPNLHVYNILHTDTGKPMSYKDLIKFGSCVKYGVKEYAKNKAVLFSNRFLYHLQILPRNL